MTLLQNRNDLIFYIKLHVLRYANWIHLQNPNKAMVSQIFKGCDSNFEIECLNFKSFYK